MVRKRSPWGLSGGEGWWIYRDQSRPGCKVVIHRSDGYRGPHGKWETDPIDGYQYPAAEQRVEAYRVWLQVKRKPKVKLVYGDLLDACAEAARIINAPHK